MDRKLHHHPQLIQKNLTKTFFSSHLSLGDIFWNFSAKTYFVFICYLHNRYHLIIFHQLPHQMVAQLSGKQHFFIKKKFWQINVHSKFSDRKMPISDFQSQFSMSKIIRIFLKKNSLKNINLGACFLLLTFFENLNF